MALDGDPQKADERRWMRSGKIAPNRPQDVAIGRGSGRPRPDKRHWRRDQWLLCIARLLEYAGLRGRAEVLAGKLCGRMGTAARIEARCHDDRRVIRKSDVAMPGMMFLRQAGICNSQAQAQQP